MLLNTLTRVICSDRSVSEDEPYSSVLNRLEALDDVGRKSRQDRTLLQ